jgi:hypothetical protein
MDVTIKLTDQQVNFLKLFAKNHYPDAPDNLATHNPMHMVQTRRLRLTTEDEAHKTIYRLKDVYGDYDEIESVEDLITAYWKDRECPIEIISYDDAYKLDEFFGVDDEEHVICDEETYLNAYGVSDDEYDVCHYEYYYEDVAFFFILEEAKKYIEYQGHNLTHPRTYTYGAGYANKGEYHHFWQLLYDLGQKLNEV